MPIAVPPYSPTLVHTEHLLRFDGSPRGILTGVVMALTCFNLILSGMAQAASKEERESLRGLEGVYVVIENIDQGVTAEGLSKERIRAAVEDVLKFHGIPFLHSGEQATTTLRAWLHVQIGTLKDVSGRYAYMIRVFLRQKVYLEDGPIHSMTATTWESRIVIGTTRGGNLRQLVATVEEKTNEFATDFLTQNPR